MDISTRVATQKDVATCKVIVDQHKHVFGFLTMAIFRESAERGKLLVAETESHKLAGFVRFNHRVKGTETALYDICVDRAAQRQGIGQALVFALVEESIKIPRSSIVLRCPEGLPANGFYQHLGFHRIGIQEGKKRSLIVWRLYF